jgi:porin-like protein
MRIPSRSAFRKGSLALALAAALAVPGLASADEKREAQLEQRVDELERQLRELMAEVKAQRNAPQVVQAPQPSPAPAPPAKETPPVFSTAPGISVALHGFISATAFDQSKSFTFGNGQNAEFPVPGSSGNLSGVDIRNTRFWLDFTGARFNEDWAGGGRIEMDFFGGFNGTGGFSASQPVPRLRQAYMDIANDSGTKFRVGQQWDLMFPIDSLPVSLSHIAFPLGYGTGLIGWRFPGVTWLQDLNHGTDGAKWQFALGGYSGSWNGPGNNVNYLSGANADFRPQIEARLRVEDKGWMAFVTAHYSDVDLKGVDGSVATPVKSSVKSTGVEVGGVWKPGPWTLKGLVYTGSGLGEIFGNLAQFGDISDTGGYVQAGYNFTKNWSVNAFYAMSKSDRNDVIRWLDNGSTGLLENRQSALSLIYASGPFQLGLEWIHSTLDSTNADFVDKTTSGNQLNVSALYTF